MPDGQGQQRQGDEHREADEPEIERVAADRVDLPADGDERHLDGDSRRDRGDEEEDEVAVLEGRAPVRSGHPLRGLWLARARVDRRRQELDLEPLDARAARLEHREPETVGAYVVAGLGRPPEVVEHVARDGVVVLVLERRAELLVEVVDR